MTMSPALSFTPRGAPRMRTSRTGSLALMFKCIFVVRAVRAHLAPTLPVHSRARTGAETNVSGSSAVEGRRELQASALGVCSNVMFAGRMTLAVGGEHTCTVSTAGALWCWGRNDNGQTSVPASASSNQVAVSAGGYHTCSLSIAGALSCWGISSEGQINVPASASSNQVAVSAGLYHTCSLSIASNVTCWGFNDNGQTNVPSSASSNQVAVLAGFALTCSLSMSGAVTCWGNNIFGQRNVPASSSSNQVAMSAGRYHTCSLSMAGAVSCWGNNDYGQTNVPASASSNQVAVSAGSYHTCSVSMAVVVTCWGRNDGGQTTLPVSSFSDQVAVSAGGYHTCSLSRVGAVTCWGSNSQGQITTVPSIFTYFGASLPCHSASLSINSPTPTAIPTPGFACGASLYRGLPYTDLVGQRIGLAAWFISEESCRIACCAAAAGCQGYSFAINDPAARFLNTPSACILFSNVTQLIPSSFASSGVLLSSL